MERKPAILCLDDDEVVLEALEHQLLKHFGENFLYEFALDPMEALDVLDQLKEEDISLFMVISDWLMPEMRGDKFIDMAKKLYPDAKSVLLTGKTQMNQPEIHALDLFGFLYKPWDEKDLCKTIKDAYDQYCE